MPVIQSRFTKFPEFERESDIDSKFHPPITLAMILVEFKRLMPEEKITAVRLLDYSGEPMATKEVGELGCFQCGVQTPNGWEPAKFSVLPVHSK